MTHTGVPKRVNFIPNDVEISEITYEKLVATGLTNYTAKAYEFSKFVADAKPISLLIHGNEVSRMWHEIFGNLNFKYLEQLQKHSMVEGLPTIKTSSGICKGCIVDKHPKHKFDRGKARCATSILGLLHCDISGPMTTTSMSGSRYVLTFIDDFSIFTWVFFLKKKCEVLERFIGFKAYVENAYGGR